MLQTKINNESSEINTSVFRRASSFSVYNNDISSQIKNLDEQRALIYNKRGVFRWLPIAYSNDLVHGSWWFVYGSLLTILIPCFPLIAIYEKLWDNEEEIEKLGIPTADHVACYSLLIFIGIMYTIGSYAFLRAVETPKVPPLFTWVHFGSDELFGMWCFFLGTLPAVPIMAIYLWYNPDAPEFGFALIMAIFFTILTFIAVLACYPRGDDDLFHKEISWIYIMCPCLRNREYLAPCFLACIPKSWSVRKHVANDWLVVSWGLLYACIFSVLICAILLRDAVRDHEDRLIFDYATGLADMLLFTIGSMYFLAGSYPDPVTDINKVLVKDGKHPV